MVPRKAFQGGLGCHDWKLFSVQELFYMEEQLGAVQDLSSDKFHQQLWAVDMNGQSHTH